MTSEQIRTYIQQRQRLCSTPAESNILTTSISKLARSKAHYFQYLYDMGFEHNYPLYPRSRYSTATRRINEQYVYGSWIAKQLTHVSTL